MLVVTAGWFWQAEIRVRIHYMFCYSAALWVFYQIEAANYTDRALKRYIFIVFESCNDCSIALIITFVTEPDFNKWAPLNLLTLKLRIN